MVLLNHVISVKIALGIRVADVGGNVYTNLALPAVILQHDFLITCYGVSAGLFKDSATRRDSGKVDSGGAEDVLNGVLHKRPFRQVGVALIAPP